MHWVDGICDPVLDSASELCRECGAEWYCASPDYGYGGGAIFRHSCKGREKTARLIGYSKEQSYRDAGRADLADRFK